MTTLYEKRGRRYVPVQDTEAYNGLPNGFWLVGVKDGCKSICRAVDTELGLSLMAACKDIEDVLTTAISEASKAQPPWQLSPKQLELWKAFEADCGERMRMVRESAAECARRALDAVRKRLAGD